MILDFSEDFQQDLSLIGFTEENLSQQLKKLIKQVLDILESRQKRVKKLIINTPFDE